MSWKWGLVPSWAPKPDGPDHFKMVRQRHLPLIPCVCQLGLVGHATRETLACMDKATPPTAPQSGSLGPCVSGEVRLPLPRWSRGATPAE